MGSVLLHGLAAEDQREVFIVRPKTKQITIEPAFRLTGLARNLRDDGTIPIPRVQYLAIACAIGGHGTGTPTSFHRRQVELAYKRVRESACVKPAVALLRPVRSLLPSQSLDCSLKACLG